MNERIKELARDLGPVATIGNWGRVEWSDNVYPQIGDKMYAAIDLQKFAELIVRECADVTHRLIVEDGKEFPVKSVAYRLKEHFEVE